MMNITGMKQQKLTNTAKLLVSNHKGLLAMDESNPTCNKRFDKLKIPQTEELRCAYREMIVTTPGLNESISGAILHDGTIHQHLKDGTSFIKALTDKGIIPGIKVDAGTKDMAGHPGLTCPKQDSIDKVADVTVKCLLRVVPGVAFLSGGQSSELASTRLNAMNVQFKSRLPWELSFSFARAIQQPAMNIWHGKEANVLEAQKSLYHRAKCNFYARRGEYDATKEK